MSNLEHLLTEGVDRDVDDTALARIVAGAHRGADRHVRNRRIGLGAGAAVAATTAVALALSLGTGASGAGAGGLAPAGPGTTSSTARSTTATSSATTRTANTTPSLGTPVPMASRTTPAPGKALGPEWFALDLLAPAPTTPLVQDHGKYAHPEAVRPGEPPLWGRNSTPLRTADELELNQLKNMAGSTDLRTFPRVLLDGSKSPNPNLRLFDYTGAFEGSACTDATAEQDLTPVASQSSIYVSRLAFGTRDGDTSAAIDRDTAHLTVSQYPGTVKDLVAARLAGRGSCPEYWADLPWAKPTPTPETGIAGADRATLVRLGRGEMYGTYHDVLFVQKGRWVVTAHAEARTQVKADELARWFATQGLARVPDGGAE